MNAPTFTLYFKGETQEGASLDDAKASFQALFKANDQQITAFFSGELRPLKKGVDQPTAKKWLQVLNQKGLKVYLKRDEATGDIAASSIKESKAEIAVRPAQEEEALPASAKPIDQQKSNTQSFSSQTNELTTLPVGSMMLNEDEKSKEQVVTVNTDHLQAESDYDALEERHSVIPPALDLSKLALVD